MVSILVTMWPQDVLSKAFDLAGVAGMPSSRSSLKWYDPSVQAHAFCSNVVSGIYAFFGLVVRNSYVRFVRKILARGKVLSVRFWVFVPVGDGVRRLMENDISFVNFLVSFPKVKHLTMWVLHAIPGVTSASNGFRKAV